MTKSEDYSGVHTRSNMTDPTPLCPALIQPPTFNGSTHFILPTLNVRPGQGLSPRKWPMTTRISQNSVRKFRQSTKKTREHWGSFCKSTSIHGMRYLVEPRKSPLDRLWWLLVVALGLLTASYYVSRQWVKWNQTSIDANNEDGQDSRKHIPMPAVTICDNRKLNTSLDETVPRYNTQAILYLRIRKCEDRNLMYLICGDDRLDVFNYTEDHLFNLIPPLATNCTLMTTMPDIAEDWTSKCAGLVMRTLTDQGVCYTINMLMPKEIFADGVEHGHQSLERESNWTMLDGYKPGSPMLDANFSDAKMNGPYPKRGDTNLILRIYHQGNTKPQYCYGETDGFKIILHNPDEFPMVGNRENPWVPLETLVDVKSRLIYPADSMSQYQPRQRKCYLPGEKPLSYFRHYSYNNCQLECLTNLTKQICHCIDYYMPRKVMEGEPENITSICTGRTKVMCVLHAFDFWDRRREFCNCLPACTTMEHEVTVWYSNRESDIDKAEGVFENMLVTEIIVYSTDEEYVKSERRAMYTRVDFIADCGGVFGLFCGMSIISLVELTYYCFLWLAGKKSPE